MRKLNGYTVVYEPLSKYAMKSENWSGFVYEHILQIEKDIGIIPDGYEVHHLDGNKENNNRSNLILLSKGDHTRLHNWIKANHIVPSSTYVKSVKYCTTCNKELTASQSKFCSVACQNKKASKMPTYVDFIKNEKLGKTRSELAEIYGVTPQTIGKWRKKWRVA